MKRFISFLLILTLLASLSVMAAADAQSVLKTVKDRIGTTDEYDRFDSGSWENDGETLYRFSWETEDAEDYHTLSVTATEQGIVTEYSEYRESDWHGSDKRTLNRPSTESVQAVAEAFFRKIDPEICREYAITARSTPSLRDQNYLFNLQRMRNGYPVAGDTGSIVVSSDGQRVQSFWLSYTDGLKFDDPAGMIGGEQAGKLFAGKIGMKLRYETDYSQDTYAVRLSYRPNCETNVYLSALTGELVTILSPDYDGMYAAGERSNATAEEAKDAGAAFTPAELTELDNLAGLLSRDEEEKLIRAAAALDVGPELALISRNRYKNTYEGWYEDSLTFRSDRRYASVTMNAETGTILSFYSRLTGDKTAADAMTETQATEKAEQAIRDLAGDVLGQYRKETAESGSVRYIRYVNDVPFDADDVYASVDAKTGLLTQYRRTFHDVSVPSPAGALTPEQASAKFLEQTTYEPTYVMYCSSKDKTAYDLATLVYALTDGIYQRMDPFTGELDRRVGPEELPEYTDVAGHYAEKAITALRGVGVGFSTPEYRPDQTITQGEFVTLLNTVFYGYGGGILYADADYAGACDLAVRRGILKSGDVAVNDPLTRDNAAVLLIRAMGLDETASLPGIYLCPFSDVTEHPGHVAILSAMGVFHGDGNGRFLPARMLTRGDAAIVLYNYLTR